MDKTTKYKHNNIVNDRLLSIFETTLQLLILSLILAVIIVFVKSLYTLFFIQILGGYSVSVIIHEILFVLILVELYTILWSYLIKGYVKVERIVEVGIISLVREIIFNLSNLGAETTYSIVALLLVFGILFFIEKYFSKERNI